MANYERSNVGKGILDDQNYYVDRMVRNDRGRDCKTLRLIAFGFKEHQEVLNGCSRRSMGEGKKMRSKRSPEPFTKGLVGQGKALEFILSERGSFWRKSKEET